MLTASPSLIVIRRCQIRYRSRGVLKIGRGNRSRSCLPSLLILKRHARQAIAILKRIIADARHAARNRNTRQATAIIERILTDARHAVRDRYARQATATTEHTNADARHAVANRHARQAIAIEERIRADARQAVRNLNARQATAIEERILINLIILSIIVFGQRHCRIRSCVAEQIVDIVVRIEQIIVCVDNLTLTAMYFFCIFSNGTVIF